MANTPHDELVICAIEATALLVRIERAWPASRWPGQPRRDELARIRRELDRAVTVTLHARAGSAPQGAR